MAEFTCTATVVGAVSGADRVVTFSMDRNPANTPADEIVEAFISKLYADGDLPSPESYELNSAIRNKDKRVVMVIGHLRGPHDETPFLTMIGY